MSTLIVGGGAAGCMCAVLCAEGGEKTILLEKNGKTGKKIYITGKGRCNLTSDCQPEEFLRNVVHGDKFLRTAIYSFTPEDTKRFFENSGLELVTERGNRVFPASGKSSDVIKALNVRLAAAGVSVETDAEVVSAESRDGGGFCVSLADGRTLYADNLVIATGGKSYPATGSTGDGYAFAESFGHSVVKPVPSLAALITVESVAELKGLSLKNVELSAYSASGKKIRSEFGEMLFTDKGVSGPVALTLSSQLNRESGATLSLDLKPALSEEKLEQRILRDFAERLNSDLKNVTRALLPERLNTYVLKRAGVAESKKANSVTKEERRRIVAAVKGLTFRCAGVAPFEEAVVTSGGVSLKELTPHCESRLVKNLYFIGEVIDADALTGGFNLQIAFSTAAVCAKSITSAAAK